MPTLAECPVTSKGTIRDLQGDSVIVARLREMGFIRGEEVEIVGTAPFGEPILVELRGAVVALRRQEAQCVHL
jgi:Fe2+ transport system protein FeoA